MKTTKGVAHGSINRSPPGRPAVKGSATAYSAEDDVVEAP